MPPRGWLITHKDCLDGATAALIGLASGLKPVFVEPDRVAEGLAGLPEGEPVYLADVSLRPDNWTRWHPRITWLLDHHQTALDLAGQPRVTVDLTRCGAHLLYDFATEAGWLQPTPDWNRLVTDVEQYDLWQPGRQAGQNLNRLFRQLGFEWYRQRFGSGWRPYTDVDTQELARLIAAEQAFVASHVEQAVTREVGGLSVAAVWLTEEGPVNEVAHTLIERGHALVILGKPDGRLSARADERINAAKLMEHLFSGGGHARAAGGRLPAELPLASDSLAPVLDRIARYLGPTNR